MEPPRGYSCSPGMICKLKKSLYGLKQSPRLWYQDLQQYLVSQGLQPTADPSIYRRDELFVAVYVDDILVMASTKSKAEDLYKALCAKYIIKDLGRLEKYLGMDISREADSLLLHQIPYIEKLGESFNVCSDPKVTTPLTTSFEKQDDGSVLDAHSTADSGVL